MADDGPADPAPTCPEGYRSLQPWWIVKGPGPLAGFELRLDRETYTEGDELTAKLRNVTQSKQGAGNKHKYDIQYRGTDGWHTIFGTREDEGFCWTDEGYLIPPDNGFTWRFTLTQAGLSGGEGRRQSYRACQPVTPGTYRFVFWGISPEKEHGRGVETDSALGVKFRVESTP